MTKRRSAFAETQEQLACRRAALENGRAGLVPVLCESCGSPIATTAEDRAKGEPSTLYEFPENATGWTCTRCLGAFANDTGLLGRQ